MSEQLDELFAKIRNGKKLLSAEEVACVASDFTRVKTEKLLLEALEDFKDRGKEDEEWEAFHAREYRKQTLEDLRQSRLTSAEPDADALLSKHGVSLDKTSALYKQLCRASLRGLADFYVNAEIIVKGDLENPALTFSQLETSTTQPRHQSRRHTLRQASVLSMCIGTSVRSIAQLDNSTRTGLGRTMTTR